MRVHRIVAIQLAAASLALGGSALAQFSIQPSVQSSTLPAAPLTASQRTGPRAKVVYAQGQLEISADNASLNQLLHEIAARVGMKIKGSVAEQPVYGKYGPATPAEVLTALLDGTGSNMLLTAATSTAPAELVLTPRQGGPTPPDSTQAAAALTQANLQASPATQTAAGPGATPAPAPSANSGGAPAAGTSANPTDPARTQQQIYEHIRQLQAMQHQQPPQ